MAGTWKGRVDCLTNTTLNTASMQEIFTNCYQFFETLQSSSYAQLIALQTGSLAAGNFSGGTNFYNQAKPFGENAWAVYRIPSGSAPDGSISARAVDYYVLFQWSFLNAPGTSPGGPAHYLGANSGNQPVFGWQVAWRDDGGNCWNGTTFSTGTAGVGRWGQDNKSSPVWTNISNNPSSGSTSTLHVLPRSSGQGGSFAATADNMAAYISSTTNANVNFRYHFLADRDSFFFVIDQTDNNSYDSFGMHGVYDVIPNLTAGSTTSSCPMPMYMFASQASSQAYIDVASTYGDTAGTTAVQGGVCGVNAKMTNPTRGVRNDRYTNNLYTTNLEPNQQFTSATLDLFKIPVIVRESPDFGLVGYVNSITEVFNANANSANSGSTIAVLGTNGGNALFAVPWNGTTNPGTNSTRTGVNF